MSIQALRKKAPKIKELLSEIYILMHLFLCFPCFVLVLIFGISIPILFSILIRGMLVCIASFVIKLYLHPLFLIISIVLLYSSSSQFQASMGFLWMELWTSSRAQMIVCTRFFYPSLKSIMPLLKLPMNLKCNHFFYINPLVTPSLSLKAFVVL